MLTDMQLMVERLREIETTIVNDPTFRTLTLHPTTIPYLSIRAEEIIRDTLIKGQEEDIAQLKGEIERMRQHQEREGRLRSESSKEISTYQQVIKELKQELKVHKKIEVKSLEQYDYINQKQQQIRQKSTQLHKQMLVNQSLKRNNIQLENELNQLRENEQHANRLKLDLQNKIISLESINSELQTKIQSLVCEVENQTNNLQKCYRLIQSMESQRINLIQQLQIKQAQVRQYNRLGRTQETSRLRIIRDQILQLKTHFNTVRDQTLLEHQSMWSFLFSNFQGLKELWQCVKINHSNELAHISEHYQSNLASTKIHLTRQLLNTKKQLRLYHHQLEQKENMKSIYQNQLQKQRDQSTQTKIQNSNRLIQEITKKLSFEEELCELRIRPPQPAKRPHKHKESLQTPHGTLKKQHRQ